MKVFLVDSVAHEGYADLHIKSMRSNPFITKELGHPIELVSLLFLSQPSIGILGRLSRTPEGSS